MYNVNCNEKYFTEVTVLPKDLNVVILLDYYGGLLPQKQRCLVEQYYCEDLSLAEISDNYKITRQGARDAIVRAVQKLRSFEESVGLVNKSLTLKKLAQNYKKTNDNKDLLNIIEAIEEL